MIKIAISGLGKVGIEFIKILKEKRKESKEKYGIEYKVVAVVGSQWGIIKDEGIELDLLLTGKYGSELIKSTGLAKEEYRGIYGIMRTKADVLIEASPTVIEDGGAALDHLKEAIKKKMDIITLAKGPLVLAFDELMEGCRLNKKSFKFSGTTAAALPTIDIGEGSLAGCEIKSIVGILNGTTNYILSKMMVEESSFETCLQEAIEAGIAEKNHHLDTSGFDTACKILILAKALMGSKKQLRDIKIKGIEDVTLQNVFNAKESNRTIKLIGRAYRLDGDIQIEVAPLELSSEHLLAQVNYKNKGILFDTDLMGEIAAIGGKSDPRGAAAAAFKDLINIYKK